MFDVEICMYLHIMYYNETKSLPFEEQTPRRVDVNFQPRYNFIIIIIGHGFNAVRFCFIILDIHHVHRSLYIK